jgi:hypothetical protein
MTNSLGILDLMNGAEVIPTSATYTALLQGFAEVGDKINLLKTYREMSMRTISLNEKQIMKVVTSLVTTGHQDIMKDVSSFVPLTFFMKAHSAFVILTSTSQIWNTDISVAWPKKKKKTSALQPGWAQAAVNTVP